MMSKCNDGYRPMGEGVYVANFETRAGEQAEKEARTWVWAWAICDINNFENVTTGNTIESFFNYLRALGNSIVYFHNLKFDGMFILSSLYSMGYKRTTKRGLEIGELSELIDMYGKFFTIKVRFSKRCQIEFRDSAKKIPASVEAIGKAYGTKYQKLEMPGGYELDRLPGQELTEEEKEYVSNDVRVVAEVIKAFHDMGHTGLTIGSDCIKQFTSLSGNVFNNMFPAISSEEDDFIRKSYRGGWCFVNPKYAEKNLEGVYGYDVNSLYPSVMHSSSGCVYPWGYGVKFEGEYVPDDEYPLFVQRLRCCFWLKPGRVPFVQLKNYFEFKVNEYPTECDVPVEITLCSVDLEAFFESYDVIVVDWLGGYKYGVINGVFDKYIERYMNIKMNAEGVQRQVAKLFLNNLYGKFGTAPEVTVRETLWEDHRVKFREGGVESRRALYLPVAIYITAYARRRTIEAAQKNFKNFVYSDTDSIYTVGPAEGIDIDPRELGKWKFEGVSERARFLRQKTYIKMNDGKFKVTASGMTKNAQAVLTEKLNAGELSMEDFTYGLTLPGVNIKAKSVEGGAVLYHSDYTLRP